MGEFKLTLLLLLAGLVPLLLFLLLGGAGAQDLVAPQPCATASAAGCDGCGAHLEPGCAGRGGLGR